MDKGENLKHTNECVVIRWLCKVFERLEKKKCFNTTVSRPLLNIP